AVRGLIYQVGQKRPKLFLASTNREWDPNCGAEPSSEDLLLGQWFRQRYFIHSICKFPGTDHWLGSCYDIIAVRQTSPASVRIRTASSSKNSTLRDLFSHNWRGNLLVFKRGLRDQARVVNMTRAEISLVNALVHR
ncbi:hypothetical protein C8Q76DRAFT_611741, partial [Earliella scabrosa]